MSERSQSPIWLAAGLRTPFVRVDGPFARRDALALSVPVVQAMARQAERTDRLRRLGLGRPEPRLEQPRARGLAGGRARSARPEYTTVMQCATSMVGAFQAAGLLQSGLGGARARIVGGVESMSRVQIGLAQKLSDWLRRVRQARGLRRKLDAARTLRPRDLRLDVPEVRNRSTGKSMGEHCEEMARGRGGSAGGSRTRSRSRAIGATVAARERGFFDDLVVALDGVSKDAFPRPDTSLEKLAALPPAFDQDERPRHAHRGQQLAPDRRRGGRLGGDGGRASPALRPPCRARACSTSRSPRSTSSTRGC